MNYDPMFYEITDWHYSNHQLKKCKSKIKALRQEFKELGEQIEELKDYESSESDSEFRDENSGWKKRFVRKRGFNLQKQLQDILKSKNLVEVNLFKLQEVNHLDIDTLEYKKNDTNINNELSQVSNDDSCDLEPPQFKKDFCSSKDDDVDSTNQLEDNNLEKQKTLLTSSEQSILKEIHSNFKAKSSKISNIIVLQQQDIDELLKDKNQAQQQEILQQSLTRYKIFEDNLTYQIYLFNRRQKRHNLIIRYRKQRKIRVELEGLIKIKKDLEQKIGKIKPRLIIVLKSLLMDKLIEDTF